MATQLANGKPDSSASDLLHDTGRRQSVAATSGWRSSASGMSRDGCSSGPKPTDATDWMCCCCGSIVSTQPRPAPATSANCAIRNAAAVENSFASEMTERSSASRSPLRACCCVTATPSRVALLKPAPQLDILRLDPLELRLATGGQLTGTPDRRRDADRLGILQVGLDRSDDDARFHGHQIDSH